MFLYCAAVTVSLRIPLLQISENSLKGEFGYFHYTALHQPAALCAKVTSLLFLLIAF